MNTGSRDEAQMLANIGRAARALERIADALETSIYGVTGTQVEAAKAALTEAYTEAAKIIADETSDVPSSPYEGMGKP